MVRDDIRAQRTFPRAHSADIDAVTDQDVITPTEIENHAIYTEFLVPHGLGWYCASSISPDPSINVFISVQRSRAKAPFSDEERKLVAALARHAERSLRLSIRLSIRLMTAEISSAGLADALERVGVGIFMLDRLGRVVFQNSAGKAVLGDSLAVSKGRLKTRLRDDGQRLAERLDAVLGGAPAEVVADQGPIVLRRASSERPLVLYVLPLVTPAQERSAQFLVRARALVLAIDMKPGVPADPAVVRDVLGITLGEARVAALVGSGLRPREAAEKLGISEETARNLLKRAFARTGVSRQSELATLLTKLVLLDAG